MGKRGPKPKGKIEIKWSANFAYGVGLLVTDGNLSKNGRHIAFVSKDIEQIKNFLKAFKIKNIKIGVTVSGYNGNKAHKVQFGDVLFHQYLSGMGITPNKSKTTGELKITQKYFFDFLRGCLDGDGYTYSYWDPRWKSSFMFYTGFTSASIEFMLWLRKEIAKCLGIKGHIKSSKSKNCYQLKYAKRDS